MMPIRSFTVAVVASVALHAAAAVTFHPNKGDRTGSAGTPEFVVNLSFEVDQEVIANWQTAPHTAKDTDRLYLRAVYPEPAAPPPPAAPPFSQTAHPSIPAPDSEVLLPIPVPELVAREVPSSDQPLDVGPELPETRVEPIHANEVSEMRHTRTPPTPRPPKVDARPADDNHSTMMEALPAGPNSTPSPTAATVEETPGQIQTTQLIATAETVGHSGTQELSLLHQYGISVRTAIRQQLIFPLHARSVGLQGTTILAVTITRSGELVKNSISNSSGHPVLDQAAYTSARKSKFPPAPNALTGERFAFRIPITFQLP